MSTGDLLGMTQGEGRATVFTTPIGRMVDAAVVLAFDDSLLMICGTTDGRLNRWLRKYIFFQDDVQLTDEAPVTRMTGFFGAGAADIAGGLHADAAQLPRYGHTPVGEGALIKALPLEGAGYYLLGAPDTLTPQSALSPNQTYEDARIRAGYPAAPQEINDDYIPLEAGMTSAINFRKGCYIGQEIIARMESRGQLAKRLMRLESDQAVPSGAALTADGANAGVLTSVTSDGGAALGYVRSMWAHTGQALSVGDASVRVVDSAGI
jgi:aminomethyltransferase